MPPLVAVVGAGPAGIYAAEALAAADRGIEVAVIDRLPVPFGLVRYGVAPDHPSIRSIRATLERTLDGDGVRFFGNVSIGDRGAGADVDTDALRGAVDAVVYAYGAASARTLGVPGEDLPGSFAAADLVAWYCGHPDAHPDTGTDTATATSVPDPAPMANLLVDARAAVVVGAGNVALDIARVLLKTADELSDTDMADEVLTGLRAESVHTVHLVIRRGPADTAFTTKELRELGEIDGLAIEFADPAGRLDLEAEKQRAADVGRIAVRNVDVFLTWRDREHPADGQRRLVLHFWSTPVEITGTDRVGGVRVRPSGAVDDEHDEEITSDLVVRAIGYLGRELPGVPYDADTGRVPQDEGRVLRDGGPARGEYVTGWIKRGPVGVIGTNKHDAAGTVASLVADLEAGALGNQHSMGDLESLLGEHGVGWSDIAGWHRIDAAEIARGVDQGRDRSTIAHTSDLLAAANDPDTPDR